MRYFLLLPYASHKSHRAICCKMTANRTVRFIAIGGEKERALLSERPSGTSDFWERSVFATASAASESTSAAATASGGAFRLRFRLVDGDRATPDFLQVQRLD